MLELVVAALAVAAKAFGACVLAFVAVVSVGSNESDAAPASDALRERGLAPPPPPLKKTPPFRRPLGP